MELDHCPESWAETSNIPRAKPMSVKFFTSGMGVPPKVIIMPLAERA
jgi:hypothetical protein